MKLSKNFSLKELTKSQTAMRHGIDNNPNKEQMINLVVLTHCVLQPIRDEHGRVDINSGLRVLELNQTIGSSDNSQHVLGMAADIECPAVDNFELAKWINNNLDFDQLILEFYTAGEPTSGWVHVSYNRDGSNRKKAMTAVKNNGKTVYQEGLHG
jgi:zinc D-Ala-D-Ala carboxypeptidase